MKNNFKRILVANRGEIACRIIRTIKGMGREAIALYSEADKNSLHTTLANESYLLGPSESAKSYLKIDKIIEIARKRRIDAIHPGYGFLSENSEFVLALKKAKIEFIGPSAQAMQQLGDKISAKKLAARLKIPIINGIVVESHHDQKKIASKLTDLKFPLLVKASGGGGGRGMRIVKNKSELSFALESARREAATFFGNDQLFIERYIDGAKHIEVQIIGDSKGNVRHLFERDCTFQRNHQKIIEEAPASQISESLRHSLHNASIKLAKGAKYSNLGTVEFLVLPESEEFYFLEVNTRLQVEHPVTEAITNLDLVKLQIEIAEGKILSELIPPVLIPTGHAIESRICAEDPIHNFQPQSGAIDRFISNSQHERSFSKRIDTGFREGDRLTHYYDSLISKLIVHADNREGAIKATSICLADFILTGIRSNISYLIALINQDDFQRYKHNTNSAQVIAKEFADRDKLNILVSGLATLNEIFSSLNSLSQSQSYDIWSSTASHRIFGSSPIIRSYSIHEKQAYTVKVEALSDKVFLIGTNSSLNEDKLEIKVIKGDEAGFYYQLNQQSYFCKLTNTFSGKWLSCHLGTFQIEPFNPALRPKHRQSLNLPDTIRSVLPGKIIEVPIKIGQNLSAGQDIAVIESMKMEHRLKAPQDAKVIEILVGKGDTIEARAAIARLEYK